MSVISEKSPKHCANKQAISFNVNKNHLFFYLFTLFLTILSLIFLIWFILHPKNPNFSLKQAQINHPNSTIHLTILSTNPNKKVGIFYDQLRLHASYNGQIITHETSIPLFFQDHEETNLLSASLDPSKAHQVLYTGKLELDFKLTGKLRWKVGNWVSGSSKLSVICVTILPFWEYFFQTGRCMFYFCLMMMMTRNTTGKLTCNDRDPVIITSLDKSL